MKRMIIAALAVACTAAVADAGTVKKHRPSPPVTIVKIFGGQYVMTRPGCDYTKNGAAWLDACEPDGMAAGGSGHRRGRGRH